MTSILHVMLLTAVTITALNACTASKQKNPITTAPQASNSSNEIAHLTPVIMLQPERFMLSGINDPYVPSHQQLHGLFADDLYRMFGVPDFKYSDPPAEIWQYRKDSCLLDVFLYIEKHRPDIWRVRYAEVRGRSVTKVSQKKCFLEALVSSRLAR